jgi:hypothetical protein
LKTLITFLFLFSFIEAAWAVTVPAGRSVFGPIAITQLDKITDIQFERTSNTFTSMKVTFQYCPSIASPCIDDDDWIWYGHSIFPGGGPATALLGSVKELPVGVTATHIRINTDVIGGTVNIQEQPTIRMRGKSR